MQTEMNDRTLAFLLNDRLDFTMYDLCRFIEENHKSIDVGTIKKNFLELSGEVDEKQLNSILSSFVVNQIKQIDDSIDNLDLITENIDVFFDITSDSNSLSVTIERSTYN